MDLSPNFAGGVDYVSLTDYSVSFGPGISVVEVNITINDESVVERDEQFTVIVTAVSGVVLGSGNQAVITIQNDDGKLLMGGGVACKIDDGARFFNTCCSGQLWLQPGYVHVYGVQWDGRDSSSDSRGK